MKKSVRLYCILSAVFIPLSLFITINQVPWIDEVSIGDTPAHFLLYGKWFTTDTTNPSIYISLYQPLYSFLWLVWSKFVGFSITSSRLFNLTLEFLLGLYLICLYKKITKESLSVYQTAVFTYLFYLGCIMIPSLRGRVEILCALLMVLFLIKCTDFMLRIKYSSIWLFGLATAIIMTGIQATVTLLAVLIYGAIFYYHEMRKVIKVFALYIGGSLFGLTLCTFFFAYFGLAKVYLGNVFFYSGTFRKIYALVAPYIGDTNDKYGIINQVTEGSDFLTKFVEGINRHPTFEFLLIGTIMFIIVFISKPKVGLKSKGVIAYLVSLAILVTLLVAGRYTSYYQYFVVVPMSLALGLWADEGKIWLSRTALLCCIIYIATIVYPVTNKITETGYNNLKCFVERNEHIIGKNDNIASPHSLFYELKPRYKNIFFTELYPCDSIENLKFIFMPGHDIKSDQFSSYYNTKGMETFFNKIITDSTYSISLVDSLAYPQLRLYRIEHLSNRR